MKLYLGGHAIPIRFVPRLKMGGKAMSGLCQYLPDRQIQVNSCLRGGTKAGTILHEALHQLSDIYTVGLRERQVAAIENAVFNLIASNPRLVKMIQGAAKQRHKGQRRKPPGAIERLRHVPAG